MSGASTILFDLDDTLIQESASVEEAFRAAGEPARERHGVDPERLHRATRQAARELWFAHPDHRYARDVGISSWEALWARFLGDRPELCRFRDWSAEYRRAAWERGLGRLEVSDGPLAAVLAERFVAERRKLHRLYPETRPVLGLLRESGRHRLGLLTNGLSCLQREKLHGAGLEPYFDAVCVSGDLGVGKPDRRPFDLLLERLGGSAEHAVMIGDNPERDIAGARAAGLKAIWIDHGDRSPVDGLTADHTIATLEEVPKIVAGL